MDNPHFNSPPITRNMIGKRVPRSEDAKLLTGRGRYLNDIDVEGQLHACFVRSPAAHGRILKIDTSVASALPGVHLIWTSADIESQCAGMEAQFSADGCLPMTMPLLAKDVVRYVGEPVVLVVADSRAVAEDACDLIGLDLEDLEAVLDPRASIQGGPVANGERPDNVGIRGHASFGDVDEAFNNAAHVVSALYHPGRVAAAPMETRGCLADYDWAQDRLKLWVSAQMPHYVKLCLNLYLGFDESRCEVISPDTGGGFGQKAHVFPEEMLMPLASKHLRSPIKWVEDRRENLLAGSHAHEQFVTIEYAANADGRITGVRTHALVDGGAYHMPPQTMAVESWCTAAVTPTGVYDIPATEYVYEAAVTNKCPMGAYRGVGYMAGTLARECLMDDLGRKLNMSPFDIRRLNVVPEFPWTNPQGIVFDEGSWLETINVLEEMVDYPAFLKRQAEARKAGKYLGLGISVFVESSGESTGMLKAHGMHEIYHDTATVKMDSSGSVTVTSGLNSQGQGHETTLAQVAADVLGVSFESIVVDAGTSTKGAYGSGTVGSRAGVIASGCVNRAAYAIREKLVAVAANMLESSEDDIVLENGMASVAGAPESQVSIADVAMAIYWDESLWPVGFEPEMEFTKAWDTSRPMFSNGGHAMIVELDPATGFVNVEQVFSVEDCGVMINPTIVEGQIRGGVVQGIGLGLFEQLVYDKDGNLSTTSFLDYQTPTMDVSPPFEIRHLETPSKISASGVKGMGESGLIAAPAAVLNAVNDALAPFGSVLYELPATPEKMMRAMQGLVDLEGPEPWSKLWERAGVEPRESGSMETA
ncbi:2,6-dihydroxypyridine 3-hydroxylase subunit NdhC [Glutamicibacter nicotianae]|uniref:Aldehyde dehydrogenase n=1 Tax=Glutamicibacter nicotianae TaxID=37929 RepID=A0ABQ0RR29_GLUNI|nr:2,6-dihydroxypyridine 3-hydroxylase subunit NdhC [Glutamicibacter nicotianae]GEC14010.1 aldehyde dehydrogenase [Glutamicibacter nicotianae]